MLKTVSTFDDDTGWSTVIPSLNDQLSFTLSELRVRWSNKKRIVNFQLLSFTSTLLSTFQSVPDSTFPVTVYFILAKCSSMVPRKIFFSFVVYYRRQVLFILQKFTKKTIHLQSVYILSLFTLLSCCLWRKGLERFWSEGLRRYNPKSQGSRDEGEMGRCEDRRDTLREPSFRDCSV